MMSSPIPNRASPYKSDPMSRQVLHAVTWACVNGWTRQSLLQSQKCPLASLHVNVLLNYPTSYRPNDLIGFDETNRTQAGFFQNNILTKKSIHPSILRQTDDESASDVLELKPRGRRRLYAESALYCSGRSVQQNVSTWPSGLKMVDTIANDDKDICRGRRSDSFQIAHCSGG
ncbi:hypothetical protein LZ31DRAFT_552022 [Colletotrichum somersetense]|nr:hypothetical protein LZ31DRAFT_552022 [Colletotrichum somersetense]